MLKLYDTLSRKKQIFRPLQRNKIKLFVCGPTVYDFPHIGHARTYIVFDMLTKYLRRKGYHVFYLQNITDIDDKIIQRAAQLGISPSHLAKRFEREYLHNMKMIGVTSVSLYARATDHIQEIVSQTERLLQKGYAYHTSDGIYYDITKFKDYGKLSRRTTKQAEDAVSRIDESVAKKNKGDFCLWKLLKGDNAHRKKQPAWSSPWGTGRPGWHIEDTAITEKYFGAQYDIHGGAVDLVFPHHEAEIAQMEAISGKKPLVKYWLHTGFLTVRGQKMAKSLGNFVTIRDFLKKYSPRVLRLFVLKSHYKSPLDYSENAIWQTEKELEKIDEFVDKLKTFKRGVRNKTKTSHMVLPHSAVLRKAKKIFEEAMEDDLNTPKAIAALFDLIHEGNRLMAEDKLNRVEAKQILTFLWDVEKIFGFIAKDSQEKEKVPQKIRNLVAEREQHRREKNWNKADALRKLLKKLGYYVEDTKGGPKIKKIKRK